MENIIKKRIIANVKCHELRKCLASNKAQEQIDNIQEVLDAVGQLKDNTDNEELQEALQGYEEAQQGLDHIKKIIDDYNSFSVADIVMFAAAIGGMYDFIHNLAGFNFTSIKNELKQKGLTQALVYLGVLIMALKKINLDTVKTMINTVANGLTIGDNVQKLFCGD